MDYSKVDAALATALSESAPGEDEPCLVVSVRTLTPPDTDQQAELVELGVQGVEPGRRTFSATLSPRSVERLAQKPWVRLLSLAQRLHPHS